MIVEQLIKLWFSLISSVLTLIIFTLCFLYFLYFSLVSPYPSNIFFPLLPFGFQLVVLVSEKRSINEGWSITTSLNIASELLRLIIMLNDTFYKYLTLDLTNQASSQQDSEELCAFLLQGMIVMVNKSSVHTLQAHEKPKLYKILIKLAQRGQGEKKNATFLFKTSVLHFWKRFLQIRSSGNLVQINYISDCLPSADYLSSREDTPSSLNTKHCTLVI